MIRAASLRVPWGRLALDGTILVLGFGAFFWFFVIRPSAEAGGDADVLKYVLTQTYIGLNCLMVMAFGMLLIAGGGGPLRRRTLVLLTLGFATMFLADIVWAMSQGHAASTCPAASRTPSTCPATSRSAPPRGSSCAARPGTSRPPGPSTTRSSTACPTRPCWCRSSCSSTSPAATRATR